MVESSKILTVSYGTFSCTLEGFDDSFSTMKAIAEYFRDLAAGDRYFGAEPPTPDAQMLAHIAEQEIARRVEATSDENGIVLRAAAALAPAAVTPEPSDAVAAADVPTETPERMAPVGEVAEPIDSIMPDTAMMADDIVEEADDAVQAMPPLVRRPDDAPEAQDLAAAEAEADAAPEVLADDAPAPQVDLPETSAATDDTAQTPAATEEETPPLLVVSEPVAAAEAEPEVEADFAPSATFADMETSPIVAAPVHPDANSVAAKLQRIRAVVGKNNDLDNDGMVDEGFADAMTPVRDVADNDSIAAIMAATVGDDTLVDDDSTYVEDDMADIDMGADDAIATSSIADIMAQDDDVEDAPEMPDETAVMDVGEPDMPSADDIVADTVADDTADAIAEPATSDDNAVAAEEAAEPEAVAPRKPTVRARILRVSKPTPAATAMPESPAEPDAVADVDDAPETNILADMADDETYSVAALDGADELTGFDDAGDATLPDADEAELMAELDAVASEAAEIRAERLGRDTLPDADDAAMSRIMDQADEELSNPEGNRRRNAIAQLKAAVAATEAARQLGDNKDPAVEAENAFREDLDQVVRPRRPDVGASRSERPRPAPLKLVASQRVDMEPAAAPATPVRPRRVATAETATPTDASNFAEFAADMGATELPDLLEAAAAYTAYVEGIEDFSRPQIMKKVQLTASEAFSREDGLRSFGTLLRQGRISKVRNGRFQVSDQTRFKPEQRAG